MYRYLLQFIVSSRFYFDPSVVSVAQRLQQLHLRGSQVVPAEALMLVPLNKNTIYPDILNKQPIHTCTGKFVICPKWVPSGLMVIGSILIDELPNDKYMN